LHLPKCLKPKVSTNSQNSQTHPAPHHTTNSQQNSNESAGSGSVCQSIKKSFNNVTLPHKSSFRSKSDNCLHKIHQTNQNVNNNHNNFNNNPENHHQNFENCEENNGLIKKSFSRKLARAFASLVQTGHTSNTTTSENNSSNQAASTSPTSIIENNHVDNAHQICSKNEVRNLESDEHDRTISSSKVTNNLTNLAAIVKSTSLERNINCRLTQAEEQARRTRSLERNHRHLVTIDSTCRYSREVGSTQINLPGLPASIDVRHSSLNQRISSAELSGRYHPDPTCRRPLRRTLTSSSSSASTSSSASSTQSNPEPLHCRRRVRRHKMATTSTPKSKVALPTSNSSGSNSTGITGAASNSERGSESTLKANSTFVNKPARGWLHPDYLFAKDGINYNVRYMGCLEVNTSMKVLDFDTRSAIAKECINRLCEASDRATTEKSKSRKTDPRIGRMLSDVPCLENAGTSVQLTITSLWLKLSDLNSGNAIFVHEMPNISFASGGDSDKLDFVAYVAKNRQNVRSCYVLECSGGLSQDVITTIGQAFELRFKEFLKRTPVNKPPPLQVIPAPRTSLEQHSRINDVEYYNDLPGKTPPEFSPVQKTRPNTARESVGSNLIDLHSDMSPTRGDPDYVNGEVPNPRKSGRDPFDMSPFATNAPVGSFPDVNSMKLQLMKEEWFHGPISRLDAENLLKNDGDFLVRESPANPGQYVLTGLQNNLKKHLLLVDPEGIVRTKDRTFDSVSHLINHHRDTGRPIISADSALRLVTPVRLGRKI